MRKHYQEWVNKLTINLFYFTIKQKEGSVRAAEENIQCHEEACLDLCRGGM